MRRFYIFAFRNSKFIFILSIIIFILSLYLNLFLKINYDLYSLLPQDVSSVKALNMLRNIFKVGEEAYVLISFKDIEEVEKLKREISKINGVSKVSWVSDLQDIFLPEYFWEQSIKENFIKGGYTLLRISFSEPSQSPLTEKAGKEIKKLLPKNSFFTGNVAIAQDLSDITQRETIKYLFIGSLFVIIFLFLIFPSMYVPLIIYYNIFLSILINTAISVIFREEISFISRMIVGILQMGVTMDYAIFLYHRYEEESEKRSKEDAGWEAIKSTARSIIASAGTTIAGFWAMTLMRFGLGKDLGFILMRGVIISFILSITLLPVLFYHFHNKWYHSKRRVLRLSGERLSNFILQKRYFFFALFILGAISLFLIPKFPMDYKILRGLPENVPSIIGQRKLEDLFNKRSTIFIIGEEDPLNWQKIVKILRDNEKVSGIMGYYAMVDYLLPSYMIPLNIKESFLKGKLSYISVDTLIDYGTNESYEFTKEMREKIEDRFNVKITGIPVLNYDLKNITTKDLEKVNIISIISIFLIIALSFLSLPIPIFLVFTIEMAITINLFIDYIIYGFLFFSSNLFICAIQLGATIDYAVLITSRYLEAKRKGLDRFSSARFALGGINSIINSAGTMFLISLPLGIFSDIFMAKNLAMLVSRGALISVIFVTFFVVPLLTIIDPILDKFGFIRKEA
ncbi:MAG: efflux RND transporter permease subunit [Dictyoglomaceae bacterium]|nr:efflux RND transporter permease subunit [Dictyoglomaceae bacterium]